MSVELSKLRDKKKAKKHSFACEVYVDHPAVNSVARQKEVINSVKFRGQQGEGDASSRSFVVRTLGFDTVRTLSFLPLDAV